MVAVGRMVDLVDGYVAYMRSRGFKIQVEAYTLGRFAAWADAEMPGESLSSGMALAWLGTFDGASDWYGARLWETLRTFSRWACASTRDPPRSPRAAAGATEGPGPTSTGTLLRGQLGPPHALVGVRARVLQAQGRRARR